MANQPLHHEFGSALKTGPAPTGGGTHGGLEETKRFLRCATRPIRAEQKSPLMVRQPFDMSSEALAKEEAQRGLPRLSVVGRPVGTTVHSLQSLGEAGSVVRLKDPGLKSERIKITMKFYPQTDISNFRHLPISNLTKYFFII